MEVKLFSSIQEAKKILENRVPCLVRFNNQNLCIIRIEENLVAFHNECPHMGDQLHKGTINYLNEIVCPLHGYRFNLQHGDETSQRCQSLRFVPVIVNETNEVCLDI